MANPSAASALPTRMRYVAMAAPGGPEVLALGETDLPMLRDDEVLIAVAAAGVNRPDIQQRKGAYPPPPGASPILGLEAAGHVVARGKNVTTWSLGDDVTALCNGGAYADYVAVPAAQCLPVPRGLSLIEAASLPETYFTVWANLFDLGRLAPGESALIHGGSSGIGVTAIQLGAAFGANMYATAGSAEKCTACTALGATAAINYHDEDFGAALQRLTNNSGVDVVLDMVGAPYIARNLQLLKRDGRLVQIAFMQGNIADKLDLLPIMLKRLSITGSTMRPRSTAEKGAIAQSLHRMVWPWLEQGRVKPVVHEVVPAAAAAEAHRLMETSTHIGKIILDFTAH
ncbi:MAG: NAD(P)H-quinone oxidoreductase [Acidiphilium sp.]